MSRSDTKKVLKYIKKGSVSRLRNFVRKRDVDLNEIRDSQGRSVLHLACHLGEGRIAKCLLRCGANPCVADDNGNTPLHMALEYTMEFNSESAFVGLVIPLIKKSKRVMHLKNKRGETPEELYVKLKKAMRQDYPEEEVAQEEEEVDDDERKQEEEWLEKLAFENSCEDFYFKEEDLPSERTAETYNEWAERIRREYYAKRSQKDHLASCKTGTTEKGKPGEYSHEQLTKNLIKEHEEYVEQTKAKKLSRERERYEQKCEFVFENETKEHLTFSSIPWPCKGNAADIVEKLAEWAGDKGKMTYMKKQRIRWHPDKFLQRCGNRMTEEDKEKIMDLVKQISQGINALLTSL